MAQFTFYSDPGHGWLQVPARTLLDIGLHPADFSEYSYVAGRGPDKVLYLEEDSDAPKFIAAYERVNGDKVAFTEVHHENTFIRNLRRNA